MRNSFVRTLEVMAAADPRIFLITGDLGFGVFDAFQKKFPKQFLNAGVAEQNMTGLAAGLAKEGRIVVTYSIANFPVMRCFEQIRNDICYHRFNVKIVAAGGGFSYGPLGVSHHVTEDLSVMRALPNMTILAPGDTWEASEGTVALIQTPGPGYLRLDRSSSDLRGDGKEIFRLGRARCLREGNDVTLISTGGILETVLKASQKLAERGMRCRVLSMHTIKPLDKESVLAAAVETGGIVTVEEQTVEGGLGGAIAEVCLENGTVPKFFYRIGLRNGFLSVIGNQTHLRAQCGLQEDAIVKTVTDLVSNAQKNPEPVANSSVNE